MPPNPNKQTGGKRTKHTWAPPFFFAKGFGSLTSSRLGTHPGRRIHPSSSLQGPHRLSRGASAAGGVNGLPPPQGCKHEKGPVLAGGAKDADRSGCAQGADEGRGLGQGRLQPRPYRGAPLPGAHGVGMLETQKSLLLF